MISEQWMRLIDGGGSTTMTIEDCWLNNTVNYPSDNSLPITMDIVP